MDNIDTQLPINDEYDLVLARVRVREAARRIGMSLMDQSRISLATSTLANAMGLGRMDASVGYVLIEKVSDQGRIGLRVTCSSISPEGYTPPLSYFDNERWMVDELELHTPSSNEVKVSLTKWAAL